MRLKCCVGGCDATSETHRVFCIPKDDKLRNLWMSLLVPTNPLLIGLSKEQLVRKRVCEKHFDKTQFDTAGKRIRYSYPCLFTDAEIALGEPLQPVGTEHHFLSDHNYYKDEDVEEEITEALLVIGRAGEDFHEHPSCSQTVTSRAEQKGEDFHEQPPRSNSETVMSVAEEKGEDFHGQPSCSNSEPIMSVAEEKDDNFHERPSCSTSRTVESVVKRKGAMMKKLGSKKRKFIKHVTNIAAASVGDTALQRITQAVTYASNQQLFTNFEFLSKQAKTFLIMQLKLCRQNKMARRFTLDEKLMALVLMKQSPKAYKLLEVMFALPNKRTLHRLSEKLSMEPGLNPQIFTHIRNITKNWGQKQRLCTIVFDEISLTPYLTYNEKKDEINGFVDVAGERKMRYCDHALVFMLRGICSSWRQSVAYYFCEGTISATELKNILTQVVSQVAEIGLIPLGLVCDQGSTFRTAIKQFRDDTVRRRNSHVNDGSSCEDDGSINIAGHNLSTFFDPPHLLKSIRNNFLNKDIIWEGSTASWKDIQFIYDLDNKVGHNRAVPKLTAHHVHPDKIKKMKVSVAAQVFSARTAAMLNFANTISNFHTGMQNTSATAEVVEFFDKLFDSVNGYPGGASKGKLRKAVKLSSEHVSFWTQAIQKLKAMIFLDKDSKLATRAGKPRIVRVPCLEGWIMTLESFIRLSKILFENYGVEYYYPRYINQDPLENFFGRIRSLNYRDVKPNANTFIYSFKSLVLSTLLGPHSKFSNCEIDNGETLVDVRFLFQDKDQNKENERPNPNVVIQPSTSQDYSRGSISRNEVLIEKVKVQCSAYTAGYICRKISKLMNCQSCLKTYTSSSLEDIHAYIQHREFKSLQNHNLMYPSERFLILYREAGTYIHNFLNMNCHKKNIGLNLTTHLNKYLRFSGLGCCEAEHSSSIKIYFLKIVIRLHVHNWCKIINKILKGDVEEKYVSKMEEPQKMALKKYKTYRLRRLAINK